jgi:hypothetical protein
MNEVRAFAQRQQEMAQQAAQAGNGQMDPKDMAKLKAQEMQAQIKAKNTQQSHAERTAQKRLSFEQEMAQKKANAQLDLQVKAAQSGIDLKKKAADSHIDLEREKIKNRMKSTKEE